MDANVFVYYAEPHPTFGRASEQLLLRIENGELEGFTSSYAEAVGKRLVVSLADAE